MGSFYYYWSSYCTTIEIYLSTLLETCKKEKFLHDTQNAQCWKNVPMKEMNVTDVYEINHISTAEVKSSEERSLQLWTQFMQLRKKPEKKNQDFNGVWA